MPIGLIMFVPHREKADLLPSLYGSAKSKKVVPS